ncbi:MAG: FecR family protein, partial [Rhodospirillales bacterium]|nr:FecR family protein [Rhodospirillales bacterium]
MNPNQNNLREMLELCGSMRDETITPQQFARLQQLLRQNRANVRFYARFLRVQSLLEREASALLAEFDSEDNLSDSSINGGLLMEVIEQERVARVRREAEAALARQQEEAEARRRRASWARTMQLDDEKQIEVHKRVIIPTPVFYGGIAAMIAVALWIGWAALMSLSQEPSDFADAGSESSDARSVSQQPVIAQRPVVATLICTLDAVWAERHVQVRQGEGHKPAPLQSGAELREGDKYTLRSGFAQLGTKRGAIVTLEAPCEIMLLGENRVKLSQGMLVGKCPTVESRGFTVDTPTTRIVDLGTEFGVVAYANGETDLEVFDGEVTIAPVVNNRVNATPTHVTSGQSVHVRGGQVAVRTTRTTPSQSRFARSVALGEAGPWFAYRDRLMQDPSLIAYYAFDQPVDGVLLESSGQRLFDGTIIGARWAEGRFPWKKALDFGGNGSGDRVTLSQAASDRLSLQGDFTIAVWF